MEHVKKVIVKPFADSHPEPTKIKSGSSRMKLCYEESFLRLLLHIARNDGYDEKGRLKYRGEVVPGTDISALINFTLTPIQPPEGLELFYNLLRETNVNKTLIVNKKVLRKFDSNGNSESPPEKPIFRTITTARPHMTYDYEPIVQEERSANKSTEEQSEAEIDVSEREKQPPEKRRSLIPVLVPRVNRRETVSTIERSDQSTVRRGERKRKGTERYGAGWVIPR